MRKQREQRVIHIFQLSLSHFQYSFKVQIVRSVLFKETLHLKMFFCLFLKLVFKAVQSCLKLPIHIVYAFFFFLLNLQEVRCLLSSSPVISIRLQRFSLKKSLQSEKRSHLDCLGCVQTTFKENDSFYFKVRCDAIWDFCISCLL